MSGCSVLLSVSVAKFKQRSCLRAERSQTYCCKRAKAMPWRVNNKGTKDRDATHPCE